MNEKIKIADILNTFELGLIDKKQAESKLFDLFNVSKEQLKEAKQKGYDDGHFDALMKMVK